MKTFDQVVALIDHLEGEMLLDWIEKGWIEPKESDADPRFDDADIARIHLMCEMRFDLEIDEEAFPVIISLMDQVYGLRRTLHAVTVAVQAEDEPVQKRILAILKTELGTPD